MKIIIVGGSGTIGQAVMDRLAKKHTLISASREHGDVRFDITDPASIKKMYQSVGDFDAVVSTVGKVHFADLSAMTPEDYDIGLHNKLMGQVNLVLIGQHYINNHGSFTLTSGILSHDPIRGGTSASMVNGAIDSFVKSAAIELASGIRINAISPTILTESMDKYGDYFPGFESVPAERVALSYQKSVEGLQTGQIYQVG
ncbi:MAG: short chain dehydrogenase [Gammaproteobacteria bacterium]|nr:short chain dehydrogenase [Gammaproteobacteria bacterium]